MKKLISMLLSFTLLLSLLSCAVQASEPPFSAAADGETLSVTRAAEDYSYTIVTEYDEQWNPIATEDRSVPLYSVDVPAGAGAVTLSFGAEERLAYGYTAEGGYVAAYGDYGDGTTGQTTAQLAELPDFVRVQTPYDASWNSETLYAVQFETAESEPEPFVPTVSEEALLANIAASYVGESSEWVVMDMAAYAEVFPAAVSTTSAAAKQAYIDAAIDSLTAPGAGESTYAKAALILPSVGADARELYAAGRNGAKIDAVSLLTALESHGSSAWVAPYTLAALNQGDYGTDELEESIVAAVLAEQLADGSWSEWGESVQTTANVIAGLSFYYGTDADVTAALDKAVSYLSSAQRPDGSFDAYGTGADANTQAMVVIALSALGIDAASDARFVKNGASVLDALLAFALADGSGFGYTDNTALNAAATEQGFRALVAAKGLRENGAAFNVYDFSANAVAPAYHSGYSSGGSGGNGGGSITPPPQETGITVSFELRTHEAVWLAAHEVDAAEGASVGEVTVQALDAAEDVSYVNQGGYISSITKGGTTLAAMTLGKNSGWKYSVNGEDPSVGMNDMTLSDGDVLVWYYVVDYTSSGGSSRPATQEPGEEQEQEQEAAQTFRDTQGHWAGDAIAFCVEQGIMQGTGEGAFSPDITASRAMLAKVLYALAGQPKADAQADFSDVESGSWYEAAVAWASEAGVVLGSDGKFMPQESVTREQLAVMLWRYERSCGRGTERAALSFDDAASVSSWAVEAVEWASAVGVLRGSDGCVMPQRNATRAELAQVFYNLLGE